MFQNGSALGKNVMGTMRIEGNTWEFSFVVYSTQFLQT